MNLRDRIITRAVEQHGYFTTRDARDLGIDPAQLRLMAARGRLEHPGRGVYRVPVLPSRQNDDFAEAIAWSYRRAVVSDESALALYGLSDVNPSRIHLTVPRNNYPRAQGGELYRLHRRDLSPEDITEYDDIPVTTVSRTIRDCIAGGSDPDQVLRAIAQGTERGVLRRVEVEELRVLLDMQKSASDTRGR